mgnify:CR=1 FL=1
MLDFYICGIRIIEKICDIYFGEYDDDDDFGKRLAQAPHENYPEILEHLERIEELLKSKV